MEIKRENKYFSFLLIMRNKQNSINKILYTNPLSKLNITDNTLNGANTISNLADFDLSVRKSKNINVKSKIGNSRKIILPYPNLSPL